MHTCRNHSSCISKAMRKAEMVCRDKSLRFTEWRRRVLEMVVGSHGSIKAYDILNKLKKGNASVEPPTVYRALNFLMENGLVHKLNSTRSYVGCSHPLMHNECYFLICGECGNIQECCNGELADAIASTADRNSFKPGAVAMEIKGRCENCANAPGKR